MDQNILPCAIYFVLLILMLKKLYCMYYVLPADKIENALAYDDCDSLFYDIIKFLLQVRINLLITTKISLEMNWSSTAIYMLYIHSSCTYDY